MEEMEMKAIGIRVEPTEIFYSIVTINDQNPKRFEYVFQKITLPLALNNDIPRQLSFIRTTLFSIINEYNVEFAGIRTAEGSAKTPNVFRMNIEGVIQELFSDSSIKRYFAGTFTSMASRMSSTSTKIKECCDNNENLLRIRDWKKINKKFKESLFAALASIDYQLDEVKK
jgi:hypothetical protein